MMTSEILTRFDRWLAPDGPVALILREPLEPVLGPEGVFFPPTFAPPAKGEPPYYVIDPTSQGQTAVVDTVGSQANRMEPIFKRPPYSALAPRATIQVGERSVDLLDAGHRAADALVRFSSHGEKLRGAFEDIAKRGDATSLAKLAPTSLVFGAWDSRDTQVKLPRLIGATIRASKVEALTRAAQFFSSLEKEETEEFGAEQKFLSEQGLSDAPAGRGLGGVIARDGIVREAVLNLIALRALAGANAEGTRALQRYVLGLALAALLAPIEHYLREGCLLVAASKAAEKKLVWRDGKREDITLSDAGAMEYATAAADAFGVGEKWEATFDNAAVKAEAKASSEASASKAAKKKGK
jgi:CRISPR-associated protein Csb1